MTEDEFIAQFHRHSDDESVFAPTDKMIPVDADCAFSLELADGTAMLRGLGVVLGSWPTGDHAFGAPGVHIAIVQLTTATQPIFDRLVEARARADGTRVERTRRPRITQRRIAIPDEPEGEETEEESVVRDVRHSITREMQAAPIEMVDDRASHTIRYEGPLRAPASGGTRSPSEPTRPPVMPPRLPAMPAGARVMPLPANAAGHAEPAALPDPPTYPGPPDLHESQTVPERPAFARGTPVPPDAATPLDSSATAVRPVPRRRAALLDTSRVIAARLAPLGKRLAPITARVTTLPRRFFAAPATDAPWWRNGRVAAVFVAGIVVGLLVSHRAGPPSTSPGTPVASAAPARCTPDKPAVPHPATAQVVAAAPSSASAATTAKTAAKLPAKTTAPKPPVAPAKTTAPKPPVAIAKTTAPKPPVAIAKTAAPKPPVATAKPAAPKPPATIAKTTAPTTTTKAPAATAKTTKPAPPKKTGCHSLDCI